MPINFNGREYASPESMPPDVRRAYEEALSGLADIAQGFVASSALARALAPRAHSEHFLRTHYRSRRTAAWMLPVLLVLALGGMLTAAAWLLRPMLIADSGGRGGGFSIRPGLLMAAAVLTAIGVAVVFLYRRLGSSETTDTLASVPDGGRRPRSDDTSGELDAAQQTLGPVLGFLVGFVLVLAIGLILTIGGGQKHLAGRLSVAIPALLLLGWLDSYATEVAKRREPLLGPYSPRYRHFVIWSSLGLILSAVMLLGLACYLPS